ncbi:MAG: hypothetical protein IME99_09650 [Proteobacteria bacterium]|nr:hypothetical protein [Pseudomonadota bacterium]
MKLILTVVMLLIAVPVFAEQTVENYIKYENEYADDSAAKTIMETYVSALGSGMGWTNTILNKRGQQELFCTPKNLALNYNNYIDIIDKQVDRVVQDGGGDDFPIPMLLLFGLMETFPCDKK